MLAPVEGVPSDMESKLFGSIQIGNVSIKNRFARSATHEWLAGDDGSLNDRIFDIYRRLAQGEVGLIFSGYSFVSRCGKGSKGQQGIYDDALIAGYESLSRLVHESGSRLFIQIVHCGRSAFATRDCPAPLSPTALPIPGTDKISKEMNEEEIRITIRDFVLAASRTRRAGADGAQLHCAHGFLLSEFISPFLNRREDDWGGDTDRRARIVIEILRKAKAENPGFPIAVKMNVTDGVEGGIDLKEALRIAKILDEEGIDAIETSGGIDEAPFDVTSQKVEKVEDEGYFKEYSRGIKRIVKCPVILVGGLRSLSVMDKMVTEGYADMVSMSRPLIREPNLIKKFIGGKSAAARCTSCSKCFNVDGIRCGDKKV